MRFVLGFVIICVALILPQDIPSVSKGDLQFYVDYASFKGKVDRTYQEFYLMIHADELRFNNTSGNDKKALFKVTSVIKDKNKQTVAEQDWFTSALLNRDSIDLRSLVVYDQWAELLDPGIYSVAVKVVEQEMQTSGSAEFEIDVPVFYDENFSLSNIEFISKVEKKNGDNHFEKNGRIITPNPWRRYGLLIPKLSFYYEVYNIDNPVSDKFLTINYSITKDDTVVKELSGVQVKKSGKNISVVHAIDLTGLNSGIYTLKAEVNDPESNEAKKISRRFEIIQTDYLSNNPVLTENEAETGGKLLEYFATPQEYKIYNSLSLQGKTQFLINFWKEKDTYPGTAENEFLESVMQRFTYANEHFNWGNKEGYKTDKGRILIKYGMPDEINSYFSEANIAPYEIWTYTKDRTFSFVFGDVNSNGNFVLLHSTKEGEVSNNNWREYLQVF